MRVLGLIIAALSAAFWLYPQPGISVLKASGLLGDTIADRIYNIYRLLSAAPWGMGVGVLLFVGGHIAASHRRPSEDA